MNDTNRLGPTKELGKPVVTNENPIGIGVEARVNKPTVTNKDVEPYGLSQPIECTFVADS